MSGGYFNYDQYRIQQIADDLEQLILDNNKENVHRIDGLVSDDDSEESFHIRLAREIEWMDRP